MSVTNEILDLIKDDFQKLYGSRKDQTYYFELLKPMESLFIEARKKGVSFVKISKVLNERGVHVPIAILQEFIQLSAGERKRALKKKKKPIKQNVDEHIRE